MVEDITRRRTDVEKQMSELKLQASAAAWRGLRGCLTLMELLRKQNEIDWDALDHRLVSEVRHRFDERALEIIEDTLTSDRVVSFIGSKSVKEFIHEAERYPFFFKQKEWDAQDLINKKRGMFSV